MARYGLYLNDKEDKELIKHISNKNSSAYLRNLVRQDCENSKQNISVKKYEQTVETLSHNINEKLINIENLINDKLSTTDTVKKTKTNIFEDEVCITGDIDMKL